MFVKMTGPVNPAPFLKSLVGDQVLVKLKWGMEYKGELKAVDSYMNILLKGATECMEGATGDLFKDLVIRCNNILFVRAFNVETSAGKNAEETNEES